MTRLINALNGDVEIGAQMAGVALLGLPSNIYSTGFALCFISPAIAYVHQLIKDGAVCGDDDADDDNDNDDASVITGDGGVDDVARREQQHLAEQVDEIAIDDVGGGDFDLDNGGDNTFAVTRRDDDDDDDDELTAGDGDDDGDDPLDAAADDGELRNFVAQHLTYRFRDAKLEHLSLFEFCGIVAMKQGAAKDETVAVPLRGRRANASYALDARHPQASTHCLVLKSKLDVPILAGGGAPQHPGPRRKDPVWRQRARTFAAYVIVLHVPWRLDTGVPPMPLTFASLMRLARRLATSGAYVDRARLHWIRCLAQV